MHFHYRFNDGSFFKVINGLRTTKHWHSLPLFLHPMRDIVIAEVLKKNRGMIRDLMFEGYNFHLRGFKKFASCRFVRCQMFDLVT